MNQARTEMAFVLDRSGFTSSVAESAVAGFIGFLRGRQAAPGEARFTLALFDDESLLPAHALRGGRVRQLDAASQADAAGVQASFKFIPRKASAHRQMAFKPDAPAPADLQRPLSEIVADEDRLERSRQPAAQTRINCLLCLNERASGPHAPFSKGGSRS